MIIDNSKKATAIGHGTAKIDSDNQEATAEGHASASANRGDSHLPVPQPRSHRSASNSWAVFLAILAFAAGLCCVLLVLGLLTGRISADDTSKVITTILTGLASMVSALWASKAKRQSKTR